MKQQLLSDLSYDEDDFFHKEIEQYRMQSNNIGSHYTKCNAVLENGYVCTSTVEYDTTTNLDALSIFQLLALKAYLKTISSNDDSYMKKIKELLTTIEMQLKNLISLISTIKDETIKIFIPSTNELQISIILLELLQQQVYNIHQSQTKSY